MKHLETSENTQKKSLNDRPSPQNRQESRANLRVFDVEGGEACSKNSTFGYFDGAAWTSRLRHPTPIMARGSSLFAKLLTRNKPSIFLHVQFFNPSMLL